MSHLNPQQESAVQHVEGPLLVLASAGSGKTRIVTHRIARLIDLGILPSDILAVTFTNKAADEMRLRIRTLKNAYVLASTFHSLGARILRESITALGYQNDFAIYDEEDSQKLLKSCLEQLKLTDEKKLLKTLRLQISAAKNELLPPKEIHSPDRLFLQAYDLYQRKLQECNAVDFDDLLYLPVKLLREHDPIRQTYQNRWLFLLIDEYQDTNLAQYTLAKLLVEKHGNLFAVGDPDQSIYSWRGARTQNILNFESDFPGAKIVTLDQNYRSTNHILSAANALIEHNEKRFEKRLWSDLGDGTKIGLYLSRTERQEADFVAKQILATPSFDNIAIFYRTNAQSRPFEDALLAHKIPYAIIGGLSFYERREIKDLLAFLRMVISNTDLISFLRTINLPRRGLGATTLEKLVALATNRAQPIFTLCEEILERPELFKLSSRQKEGLQNYISLIQRLRSLCPSMKIHELLSEAISASRYLNYLQEDPETLDDRKENLGELIGKAMEWEEEAEEPTLPKFLEELTLRTPVETPDAAVKLMTLHNSKGLEFHTVFIVGLEEDLLPHVNAKDNPDSLEEERRLCYVGITRAKRNLYLTASTYRFMWGAERLMRPSRFLKEIPKEHLHPFSPMQESSLLFSPGDAVHHKQFGPGIVQRVFEGAAGLTYEVHFPEAQMTRTLAAKYAKLTALDSFALKHY